MKTVGELRTENAAAIKDLSDKHNSRCSQYVTALDSLERETGGCGSCGENEEVKKKSRKKTMKEL